MTQEGTLQMDEYARLLNDRTRLVAVTHISNAIGTINPIKEITAMAHDVGAKVLVDGSQSASHLKIDVQDLDIDFFVFSGHKVMGPTGVGILYGKEALLEKMPPYQGGGDMIESVTFEKTTYSALPLKFEAGTPMIAEVIGLGTAIDYIQSIGIEAIHEWENELLNYATAILKEIPGLKIIGQAEKKGALVSFIVDGIHALDIGSMLDLKGIAIRTGHHCAQPVMEFFKIPSTARASFACYTTKEEISYFADSLQEVVRKLR
jgi:cysteine desulfurase/selenocysteine lyase